MRSRGPPRWRPSPLTSPNWGRRTRIQSWCFRCTRTIGSRKLRSARSANDDNFWARFLRRDREQKPKTCLECRVRPVTTSRSTFSHSWSCKLSTLTASVKKRIGVSAPRIYSILTSPATLQNKDARATVNDQSLRRNQGATIYSTVYSNKEANCDHQIT